MLWRKQLFDEIRAAATRKKIRRYSLTDRLRVKLIIYLTKTQMESMDVDNVVKHVGDALQGRLGSLTRQRSQAAASGRRVTNTKQKRKNRVLPNDWQISKWEVEKRAYKSPKQKSRLLVQKYKPI